jgi:hypothetical protein
MKHQINQAALSITFELQHLPQHIEVDNKSQDYLRASTSLSVYKILVTDGDGESEIRAKSLICTTTVRRIFKSFKLQIFSLSSQETLKYFDEGMP